MRLKRSLAPLIHSRNSQLTFPLDCLQNSFCSAPRTGSSKICQKPRRAGSQHALHAFIRAQSCSVSPAPHSYIVCRLHPVDWNDATDPIAKREPRRGQRATLRATIETPQGPLVVYCAHLEVFCGMLARVAQLADIFADARRMRDKASSFTFLSQLSAAHNFCAAISLRIVALQYSSIAGLLPPGNFRGFKHDGTWYCPAV